MVELFISKQLFLLSLHNEVSVQERKNHHNIFTKLKKLKEAGIAGRCFVCLFYSHFRAETISQQSLLFTHQMDLCLQLFIFLTHIFTGSVLNMAAGCICFLLACKIFSYTLCQPGIQPKYGYADDSVCIPIKD